MPTRFAHTNLIAHDAQRLVRFYCDVFGCSVVPPERDLRGPWLEAATGVERAHLRGAHLRLPGHGERGPTLEIFTYDETLAQPTPVANRAGFGHIAFEVDDVGRQLDALVRAGGSRLGEIVSIDVKGAGTVRFTYARDPEGNILELQSWSPRVPSVPEDVP